MCEPLTQRAPDTNAEPGKQNVLFVRTVTLEGHAISGSSSGFGARAAGRQTARSRAGRGRGMGAMRSAPEFHVRNARRTTTNVARPSQPVHFASTTSIVAVVVATAGVGVGCASTAGSVCFGGASSAVAGGGSQHSKKPPPFGSPSTCIERIPNA